jgi:putative DNA primase/helicase
MLTSIRYHPELRYKIADKTWIMLPAMVAEVLNSDGETIAIHRTFLKRDGSGKAGVPKAKLMLGDARGGAIYLAPPSEEMNITEGIETGLSLQLINGLPTAAAASTGNMVALQLPALPTAQRITIGADNDPNESGKQAAIKAATRWRDEGREARIKTPRGLKDYNDVLRAMAKRPQGMEP